VRCEDFENRLNDAIDERRPPEEDAELLAHAAACSGCERLLRDYESVLKCLVPLRATEPSAGFTLRVISAYEPVMAAAPRTAPARGRAAAFLALAAALLLSALPAWYWWRGAPSATQPASDSATVGDAVAAADNFMAESAPPEQLAESDRAPRPALVDQVSEAYEPYLVATTETLATALGANPPEGEETIAATEASTTAPIVWDGEFAAEIRPVAVSATRSVAALLRVLPGTTRPLDGQGITQ